MKQHLQDAIWVARSLFDRNKATGSSANLSFRVGSSIYITASGTCFGRLTENDFSEMTLDGQHIGGKNPSKEFPLHHMIYQKDEKIAAVVHTHSTYATLWSCVDHENKIDCVPNITPYLKMKVGKVGLVPYEKPGTKELFDAFGKCVKASDGFLLGHHGPIVGGNTIMEAFYGLEELEESCRIAWELALKK